MSTFFVVTNKKLENIDPNLSHINFANSWSIYYDKGIINGKNYLYTGSNRNPYLNEIFLCASPEEIRLEEFFDVSDGYCIILFLDCEIIVLTDRYGKIPIFYSKSKVSIILTTDLDDDFSEELILLNPNKYISIDLNSDTIELTDKPPIVAYSHQTDEAGFIKHLSRESETAVMNSIGKYRNIGLLYSGGVDSSIIALILKKNNVPFTAYVVGVANSPDVIMAQRASKILDIDLQIVLIDEYLVERDLKEIDEIIQTKLFSTTITTVPRVVSLEVAIVLYFGIKKASEDECDVIFSAIGTEEFFIGFSLESRHLDQNRTLLDITLRKMESIYTRDMYRNYRLSSHFNIGLKTPFVSTKLYELALAIPIKLKVQNEIKKFIWRRTGLSMGLPKEIADRKNKATQFGSSSSKLISKLAKKHGHKSKSDFILQFLP
ncbi:MAG: asparagine synthase C-terminal domain-containing protein [Candidatus Hodarchaeales archaeon]